MLRVGREGIVSFPNFGYWRNRLHVLRGRMPVSDSLPYQWFDTPNIHLCTTTDFEAFCDSHGVRILEQLRALPEWETHLILSSAGVLTASKNSDSSALKLRHLLTWYIASKTLVPPFPVVHLKLRAW